MFDGLLKSLSAVQAKVLCSFLGLCVGLVFAVAAFWISLTVLVLSPLNATGSPDSSDGDKLLLYLGASFPLVMVLSLSAYLGWRFGAGLSRAFEASSFDKDWANNFSALVTVAAIALGITGFFLAYILF